MLSLVLVLSLVLLSAVPHGRLCALRECRCGTRSNGGTRLDPLPRPLRSLLRPGERGAGFAAQGRRPLPDRTDRTSGRVKDLGKALPSRRAGRRLTCRGPQGRGADQRERRRRCLSTAMTRSARDIPSASTTPMTVDQRGSACPSSMRARLPTVSSASHARRSWVQPRCSRRVRTAAARAWSAVAEGWATIS